MGISTLKDLKWIILERLIQASALSGALIVAAYIILEYIIEGRMSLSIGR